MPNPLMTFSDLVDGVIQYSGNDPKSQTVAQARRAAVLAYTNLVQDHDWQFYKRVFSLPTQEGYNTGTVAFDYTGGAVERQLTLTGGTWPTSAGYGYVSISGKTYQVSRRVSGTVVQLAEFNNPQEDLAAGTVYRWQRDMYPLPWDVTEVFSAITQPGGITLKYVPIAQWAYGRDFDLATGRPLQFTITADLNVPQRQAVRFWPAPDTNYSVLFTYKANLLAPQVFKESEGLVTLTASSAVVTGVGTRFDQSLAGTVLRWSRDAKTLPTGVEGDNPAVGSDVIDSVQSATQLTLQNAVTVGYDRVKYAASTLLDIDYFVTRKYLFAEANRTYRSLARVQAITGEMADWQKTMNMAKDADAKYGGWQGSSPWRPVLTIYDVGPVPA